MNFRDAEYLQTQAGNHVMVVWLRCRGIRLKQIAKSMGVSTQRVHQMLKKAQRLLDHPPKHIPIEQLRLADLPIPNEMKVAFMKKGIITVAELVVIPVDKIALIPRMGAKRLGRLYLTVKGCGLDFHPSWRATINGQLFNEAQRRYEPLKGEPVVHPQGGVGLQPYS